MLPISSALLTKRLLDQTNSALGGLSDGGDDERNGTSTGNGQLRNDLAGSLQLHVSEAAVDGRLDVTEAAVEFILILVLALSSSQSHAFINLMMTSRSRSDVDNLPLLVTKGCRQSCTTGLIIIFGNAPKPIGQSDSESRRRPGAGVRH